MDLICVETIDSFIFTCHFTPFYHQTISKFCVFYCSHGYALRSYFGEPYFFVRRRFWNNNMSSEYNMSSLFVSRAIINNNTGFQNVGGGGGGDDPNHCL